MPVNLAQESGSIATSCRQDRRDKGPALVRQADGAIVRPGGALVRCL